MNRMLLRRLVLLLIAYPLLSVTRAGAAGSVFSGVGYFGVLTGYSSSRATALGGAALALDDSISLNALNPAALGGITQTRASVSAYSQRHWIRDHNASAIDDWAAVEYFSMALVLKKGLALGFFLTPNSRVDYRYVWDVALSENTYTESNQGKGGLSRAALNLGWKFAKWGEIGGGLAVIWGQVDEQRTSYVNLSGYNQLIEFLNTKRWLAFGGSLGLLVQPTGRTMLGATFEPQIPVQLDQSFSYTTEDSTTTSETEYQFAARYGLGLSYQMSPQWLATGQVLYSPWSQLSKFPPPGPSEYQDSYDLAAGVEWTPGSWDADRMLKRLQYRFGGRWETGYALSQGSAIDSYFATFGLGCPFNQGRDRFDFTIEFGLRGDLTSNGAQENILRFSFGLNLGETWFIRSKPTWQD